MKQKRKGGTKVVPGEGRAFGKTAASALAPVARLGAGVAGRPNAAPEEAVRTAACPGCLEGAEKAGAPNADASKGLLAPGC